MVQTFDGFHDTSLIVVERQGATRLTTKVRSLFVVPETVSVAITVKMTV